MLKEINAYYTIHVCITIILITILIIIIIIISEAQL